MKENENKMEEFFRKSMDQFDETPSENVWSQVSERLEEEESFASKTWRSIRSILPLLLLLMTLIGVSIFSFIRIDQLKNQNNNLIGENISINSSLSLLSKEYKSLNEKHSSLNILNAQLQNEINSIKLNILESQKALSSTIKENRFISNKFETTNKLNIELLQKINTLENKFKNTNSKTLASTKEKETRNVLSFNTIAKTNNMGINHISDRDFTEKWKNFNLFQEKIKEEETDSFKKQKYRYGFTARAYNTFVTSGSPYHLSHSYGFIHELSFNKKWSLTNSLEYNDQEYSVVSDLDFLPATLLDKFPDNPGAYANVRSVKSRAKYIDTQLGIKYRWMNKKQTANYFINPSMVWQLYFPQEFTYDIIQAQDLLVERRSYTAYFGSINLQLGIEKSISEKLDFQLAVFAEKSLIELGHDNQQINLIGIRTSILFGK